MTQRMEFETLSVSINSFGFHIFQTTFKDRLEENVCMSPLSISLALALTQLGARGAASHSLHKLLCWPEGPSHEVHQLYQRYIQKLHESDRTTLSLSTANRLYLQKSYPIATDFLEKANLFYKADVASADFVGNTERERLCINEWVEEQTDRKIKDLISPGGITSLTKMVLVNAIYFKGNWSWKFDKHFTQHEPFKVGPGKLTNVPMMKAFEKYSIKSCVPLNCRAIEIPYGGEDLSMVILLPVDDFGLKDLIANLTASRLSFLLQSLSERADHKTELNLPKFEVSSGHNLTASLRALGAADAFSPDTADFRGMAKMGGENLCLSEVIHKVFIKVDEEGTEAAAATAVVMAPVCALMERPPPFVVDHPFLYLIVDRRGSHGGGAGGVVLFIGAVVDPTR